MGCCYSFCKEDSGPQVIDYFIHVRCFGILTYHTTLDKEYIQTIHSSAYLYYIYKTEIIMYIIFLYDLHLQG